MRSCVAMMLLAACGRIDFDATSPIDAGPDASNVRPADFDVDLVGGTLGPFTFARATVASYIDENRVLRYAAIDAPRFDHDPATGEPRGLFIEGTAQNRATYSEQIDVDVYWFTNGFATVTPDVAIAPDGTMTADELTDWDSTAFNRRGQGNVLPNDTLAYVCSVFLKAGTSPLRTFSCELLNGINIQTEMDVDLSTGTITLPPTEAESYGITEYADGWWRVWITLRNNASGNDDAVISVWNYRTDNTVNGSVYVWGAQFESGTAPTSYIPTLATPVTRAADSVSLTDLTWLDPTAGSMLVSGELSIVGSRNQHAACFKDDGLGYTCVSRYAPNGTGALVYQGTPLVEGSPWAGEPSSVLIVQDSPALTLHDPGTTTTVSAPASGAPYTELILGNDGTQWFDGWVRRFAYWRGILTSEERTSLGVK